MDGGRRADLANAWLVGRPDRAAMIVPKTTVTLTWRRSLLSGWQARRGVAAGAVATGTRAAHLPISFCVVNGALALSSPSPGTARV